jgi:hypothetical protein
MNNIEDERERLERNRRRAIGRLPSEAVIVVALGLFYWYTRFAGAAIFLVVLGPLWLLDIASIFYIRSKLGKFEHRS